MDKTFWMRFLNSRSDNRKSKMKGGAMKNILRLLAIVAALGCGAMAEAQQTAKMPRLGWLAAASSTPTLNDAFRQGLRELGYIEGKNVVIEYRRAEKTDQLPPLAAELVRLQVDVIFTSGGGQPTPELPRTLPRRSLSFLAILTTLSRSA